MCCVCWYECLCVCVCVRTRACLGSDCDAACVVRGADD